MTNLLTIAGIMLIAVAIFMAWGTFGTVSKTGFDISSLKTTNDWENPFLGWCPSSERPCSC